MKCVEITRVTTNFDNFTTSQTAPFYCKINANEAELAEACKYYYSDKETDLINTESCECSLMEEDDPENPTNYTEEVSKLPLLKGGIVPIPRQKIDPGLGHCPFPSQEVLSYYVKNYTYLVSNATGILHTNDRNNFKAFSEHLVVDEASNTTWANTVIS